MSEKKRKNESSVIAKYETMASRIRAGESEESVLFDYGLVNMSDVAELTKKAREEMAAINKRIDSIFESQR